ncbi:MAG: hypothetical protein J7K26_03565 [Candidatus Aenigmarchaeota archaeon]|nr:hypothetical protein [Candidatus Aenigmarchaeota archaeon]
MIKDIYIEKIYNSRKEPTIKVILETEYGIYCGEAPSGASKSSYEVKYKPISQINKIYQKYVNFFLNKSENIVDKKIHQIGINKLGGNFSIALSIAALKARSKGNVWKFLNPNARFMPFPLGNVMGQWNKKSIQEFLVCSKEKSIEKCIKENSEIHIEIGNYLKKKRLSKGLNYEGAWIPKFNDIKALDLLSRVTDNYNSRIGIDIAASGFYKNKKYHYQGKKYDKGDWLEFIKDLIKTYKLFYVEDPFHENDFESFEELKRKTKCLIVGDDLIATNPDRIKKAIKKINSVIIKPNQVGTVSKTLETVKIANKNKIKCIVSHRSGETFDTFIADLAVGINAPLIKCGIYGRERFVKLERLIKIWDSGNFRMARI